MNIQESGYQLDYLRGVVFKAETRGGKYGIEAVVEDASPAIRAAGFSVKIDIREFTDGRPSGHGGTESIRGARLGLVRTVVNSKFMDAINYQPTVDKLGVMAEASRHVAAVPMGRIVSNVDTARAHATGVPLPERSGPSDHLPALAFEAHSTDGNIVLQLIGNRRRDPNQPGTDRTINVYESAEWENGIRVSSGVSVTLETSLVMDVLLEAQYLLDKPFHIVADRVGMMDAAKQQTPAYLKKNAGNYRAALMARQPPTEEEIAASLLPTPALTDVESVSLGVNR